MEYKEKSNCIKDSVYIDVVFMVVYIETDGEELKDFMKNMSIDWEAMQKIDKHLFVVVEGLPYE